MPHVAVASNELLQEGPLIDVSIGISKELERQLQERDELVPALINCKALIDTGAQSTVVKPHVVKALNLYPVGSINILTATQDNAECNQYSISLYIPTVERIHVVKPNVTVVQAPLLRQSIDCLLGRDVLQTGQFIYSGITRSFTVSW